MPPSGPLLTLYPTDHGSSPVAPIASPLKIHHTTTTTTTLGIAKMETASASENTHPNSSHAMLSCEDSQPSLSFLEMEEEDETDEAFENSQIDQSLDKQGKETNLLLPTAATDNNSEEEKKEEEYPALTARFSSSPQQHSRGVNRCGKRPRNSLKVSFAPAAQWSSSAHTSNSRQRYGNNGFLRVHETIHLADYTPEERLATWYTLADLKSFKRERKETARQVDNGLLSLRKSEDPTGCSDIFVDTTSFSVPVEYCSRGVENCTEAISRIRYRHICDGWRMVLNTQERHNYQQQRLKSLSNSEKREYSALASLLGRNKASRTTTNHGWFRYGNPKSSSPRQTDPFQGMCCPYDLAAAYRPSSEASLEIARNRAIGDERDALAQREQDKLEHTKAANGDHQNTTVTANDNAKNSVSKQEQNRDDNKDDGTSNQFFVEGPMRTMDV